jgi:hypothetical protein
MFRVPGINFRNALLCLAITLQLLTFLKHNGSVVVGFPSAPIPSFGSAPEPEKPAAAGDAGAGGPAGAAPAVVSANVEPSSHPIGAPSEPTPKPGGPRLQTATPRSSSGGNGGGAPISGSPRPAPPSPEPAVANPAPTDSSAQEPTDPGSSERVGDDGSEAAGGGDSETPTETGEDETPIE